MGALNKHYSLVGAAKVTILHPARWETSGMRTPRAGRNKFRFCRSRIRGWRGLRVVDAFLSSSAMCSASIGLSRRLEEENIALRAEQEAILSRSVCQDKLEHFRHLGMVAYQEENYRLVLALSENPVGVSLEWKC